MSVKDILKQISNDEVIAVRLYDSTNTLDRVITYCVGNRSGQRKNTVYKLYKNKNGVIVDMGITADNPVDLEEAS